MSSKLKCCVVFLKCLVFSVEGMCTVCRVDITICFGDILLKIKTLSSKQISLCKLTRFSVFFCRVYDDSWGTENFITWPFSFLIIPCFATSFPVFFSLKLGKGKSPGVEFALFGFSCCVFSFLSSRFGEMLNKLKLDQINDTEVLYSLHQLFMTRFSLCKWLIWYRNELATVTMAQ